MRPVELPRPDFALLEASRALGSRIASELRACGNWMSFARYMEMALYEPGLGYYAAGAAKLGAGGDYVTAPELSPLFGRALARQVRELLQPGEAVLEIGAGSGALAKALLEELSCPYSILEISPYLRRLQKERLGERAVWLTRLPERFRGVILANEVADALPVHAVAWREHGVLERGVCVNEGGFAWSERPATSELLAAARAIEVPVPYESEIGLAARAWMRTLGESLERGAILVLDYGFPAREYYHPQRSSGTLMCHYRHRAHGDPFRLPGAQDVTAHVDFSALAAAAREAGLEVLGYASQANFLVNCGILELLERENPHNVAHYAPIACAAQILLSPAEMGELFKVLCVGKGVEAARAGSAGLTGFSRGDRSHAL